MSIKQNGGVFGRNPTFNDVTIDGTLTFDGDIDINSDLKIDGDLEVTGTSKLTGNVGIGIAPTAFGLSVEKDNGSGYVSTFRSNNSSPYLTIQTTGGKTQLQGINAGFTDVDAIGLQPSGGNINVGAGNFVMTSGYGIDFSATAGTGTSELFSDYEEGNWTPAFSGGDYTFTYNKQKGSYTKIGNRVYVDMVLYVHPTTAPSGTTDGNLSVTGLPYAFNKQNDVESVGGIVTFKQLFLPAIETVATRLSDTGTSFQLYSTLATNYPDSGFAQASNVGANARIRIQFSYPTNG